ncbi:hypothetical protein BH20CHL4_BH20CHL4_11050 [soil metagenome]
MSGSRQADQSLPADIGGKPIEPGSAGEQLEPVAGLVVDDARARSGEDTRRRGWFWHWNAIVTQFAPLVGLKGVGLLNSYTVWTDRREESPHRGYAFPSQQSEAGFYGEDRSELITINKILVTLDLIEIRKEMVLRVDEAGRRWRVPHNLYRVKDRDDGFSLTADAVERVVQLADRDTTVYRYIRHIFSPKFRPIDANNVWTGILETVRFSPTWARLAVRAAKEDDRASARTKAGHRSRKSAIAGIKGGDQETGAPIPNDSAAVASVRDVQTIVAGTNEGSRVDVAPANNGLNVDSPSTVAPANEAGPSDVAPSNTTYNQKKTTTTTSKKQPPNIEQQPADSAGPSRSEQVSFGPGGGEAPGDPPGQEAALRAFHDANHREATLAERKLLRDLAERFEMSARECGAPGWESGWRWVAAAIFDAVDAGSTFVAPRRVREILTRWEREGVPGQSKAKYTKRSRSPASYTGEPVLGPNAGIDLPHGRDSGSTWELAVRLMSAAVEKHTLADLVDGAFISGYRDGEVTLQARDAQQAAKLAGEYHPLVARKFGEAMRRPVRLSIVFRDEAPSSNVIAPPVEEQCTDDYMLAGPFPVPEIGLSSTQVWQAVLEDLQRAGKIGRANVEAWLWPSMLVGRDDCGMFIIGTPNSLARKRIADRFAPAIAASLSNLLGIACEVEVVIAQEWLRTRAVSGPNDSGETFDEPGSAASA